MMNEEQIIKNMVEFIEKKEKEFNVVKNKNSNINIVKNKNSNINVLKVNIINSIIAKLEKEMENENN